jgi:hypothetical protein
VEKAAMFLEAFRSASSVNQHWMRPNTFPVLSIQDKLACFVELVDRLDELSGAFQANRDGAELVLLATYSSYWKATALCGLLMGGAMV